MRKISIIFLGVGIIPYRIAGDKNFFRDLSNYLINRGIETHFVSIAEPPDMIERDNFTFIPRLFHFRDSSFYYRDEKGQILGYHHKHSNLREALEIAMSIMAARRKLLRILRHYPNPIIHWQDSSYMIPLIKGILGSRARIVCSHHRLLPRGAIRDKLLAHAIGRADAVIVSTKAAKEILTMRGVDPSLIKIATWGSAGVSEKTTVNPEEENQSNPLRLLWAGFIQQIGKTDFMHAIALAQRVVEERSDIEFTFCLKPESFQDCFLALERPKVRIVKGDQGFLGNLSSFDALFSPLMRLDSTLAPPLTWIEALSAGLPIITTRAAGISELIAHGRSGLIFDSYQCIEEWLVNDPFRTDTIQEMKITAQKEFDSHYRMDVIGQKFEGIYRRMIE